MTENKSLDYKEDYLDCANRFKAIFSHTSAATKIIDSNLNIIKVNDALAELLGYSSAEICGSTIMDFACDEYKKDWEHLQEAMWKHGMPFFKIDACLKKKDGRIIWVHVTTILFNELGKQFAYSVLDDYTYLKEYEESEKRLNMSLAYSKMAVWQMDLVDGKLTHSEGFAQILGYEKPEKIFNKSDLVSQFIPDDAKELSAILADIESNVFMDFSGRLSQSVQQSVWVHLQGRTEITATGESVILGTVQDISKEKQSDRYKDDFISIASHELKTPLTVLNGTLQLMERASKDDSHKLALLIEQANRSMKKVNALIGDLLNASRINEGQLHLNLTDFNVNEVIEECSLNIDREGKYRIIMEGDQLINIHADSDRIQQVIVNFINNAMKYAPREKDIFIRAKDKGDHIRISVVDSGPGIEVGKAEHLFERYYRVDAEGTQYSGLGLGLYISSEIIKKHGGEIGVESKVGVGSEFWFTLPK